ncbi:MAG: hypothetical protein EHM47_10725 [Ignavibacteriales bacterium]|nr:MAG: hypothetical protein EHM47_10725 [Ignavibacteriales bacterium]
MRQAQKAKDKHWEKLERKGKEEERKKKEAVEKHLFEKKKLEELEMNALLLQKIKLIIEYKEEYKKRKSPLTPEDDKYIRWVLDQRRGQILLRMKNSDSFDTSKRKCLNFIYFSSTFFKYKVLDISIGSFIIS